ncbi:Beta-galactosidase [Escherichia coli]
MDDELLKNPPVGSSVLERIRDMRASMCRVYLQVICPLGNDSNLLIVFYVQIMPDDFVMQLHRF